MSSSCISRIVVAAFLQPIPFTLLALFIASLFLLWWHHPLYGRNVGPRIYPVVGSIIALLRNKNRIYDWTTDMLKNSPSLTIRGVVFGIEILTTANPANVEHILKTRFHNYPKGYRFHMLMNDLLGRGIFNADGDSWRSQRKAASYEFTTHSLRSFILESVQTEISSRLVPVLTGASAKGTLVDLQDLFLRFAFDNVCNIALGVDPACLAPSLPTVAFAKAFDDATEISMQRFMTAAWIWKVKRALNLGSERQMKEALKVVNNFAMDVIRKRRIEHSEATKEKQKEMAAQRKDLLFRFICLADMENEQSAEIDHKRCEYPTHLDQKKEKADLENCSDELLRDMIISFVLAGRDTTSAGLSWFFWLLSLNPRVEDAIYDEIRGVVEDRKHGSQEEVKKDMGAVEDANQRKSAKDQYHGAASTVFSFEELKKMQYLQAAISESHRLYPPVPHDTKLALEEDVLPDGSRVGKNAQVSYHPFAMGRMESIWGPDCLEFKPERWLDANRNFVPDNPFKFPVFQAGPRICLGKEMAIIQMKSIAAALIHGFTLRVAGGGYTPRYSLSLTLRMKDGLPVAVHQRNNNSSISSS